MLGQFCKVAFTGPACCDTLHPSTRGTELIDEGNGKYVAKVDFWRWNVGLTVRDWRSVARIANIDVSEMEAGNVDLYKFMRKAYYRVKRRAQGRMAIG